MLLAGVAVAGWLLARLGAGWLRRSKYLARRLFEVWASAYMTVILALALIGIFPDLVRWLLAGGQENGGAGSLPAGSGTLALLSGLVTAGFAFRRSGAEVTAWFRSLGYHVSDREERQPDLHRGTVLYGAAH
jgi:hypothetical protein